MGGISMLVIIAHGREMHAAGPPSPERRIALRPWTSAAVPLRDPQAAQFADLCGTRCSAFAADPAFGKPPLLRYRFDMADAARPKLTDRQTAVLAAVERLGQPVMADLWQEFPDLVPSAIKKVLDALEKKGLVGHAGDDSQAFTNGVRWWSTALTPTHHDDELSRIVAALETAKLGLRYFADPHDRSVTVFLPLVELESHLRGLPTAPMDRLRECVEGIEDAGQAVRVTVSTKITNDPEPGLAVQIRAASPAL